MTKWTHVICEVCWAKKNDDRIPLRRAEADLVNCCFCGASTSAGIYVRHDPKDPALHCKGAHK